MKLEKGSSFYNRGPAGCSLSTRGLARAPHLVRGRLHPFAEDREAHARPRGVQCTVVDDGQAAVHAALHAHLPSDCILMACNMPVCDGWEATREIQAVMGHKTPIIAVTANAMNGDREICLAAGMDDYITKPVKLALLLDIVSKWISRGS